MIRSWLHAIVSRSRLLCGPRLTTQKGAVAETRKDHPWYVGRLYETSDTYRIRNMRSEACAVLMPVRNGEKYVGRAIESVLAQSCRDYDFVIVDDKSTDRTAQIIESYYDRRIRVIEGPGMGLSAALNRGLEAVEAPLVARIDADDIARSDWLETMCTFMQETPSVGLAGCWYREVDQHENVVRFKMFPVADEEIRKILPVFSVITHSGCMYRRQLLLDAGMYDDDVIAGEDLELWLRLAFCTKFHNVPEYLLDVRRGTASLSQTHVNVLQENHRACARKYLARMVEGGRISRGDALFREAVVLYYHGQTRESIMLFREAMSQGYDRRACYRYMIPLLVFGDSLMRLRRAGVLSRVTDVFRMVGVGRKHIAP